MTAYKKKRHPILFLCLLMVLGAGVLTLLPQVGGLPGKLRVEKLSLVEVPQWIDQQIIPLDEVSRRGLKLENIQNIVIHYVGNAGTSAQQNRNWYANPESEVSSHFLVGLDGEIIQCIPLDEYSSASNHRNKDTISIEVCHPDASGKFSDASYDALLKLTAWLLDVCALETEDVIRHYDVTGKACPLYYVEHSDSWWAFLEDLEQAVKEGR